MTSKTDYDPVVQQLFELDDIRKAKEPPDYLAMGFTATHIPELIKLGTDAELHLDEDESVPIGHVFAPIHAWRVLGLLKAEEAIEPLLKTFIDLDESDWWEDLAEAFFAKIGAVAIPSIKRFVEDHSLDGFQRHHAIYGLTKMVENYPETRPQVVQIITDWLAHYEKNDPDLNGFLVADLTDLKAVESMATIEAAYAAKRVDYSITGSLGEVQEELGLPRTRSELEEEEEYRKWMPYRGGNPPMMSAKEIQQGLAKYMFPFDEMVDKPDFIDLAASPKAKHEVKKQKNKRKMADASRKKNRKKKK